MRRVFGPEGLFERDAQRLGHSLAVCRVGIVAVARVALLDEQLGIAMARAVFSQVAFWSSADITRHSRPGCVK